MEGEVKKVWLPRPLPVGSSLVERNRQYAVPLEPLLQSFCTDCNNIYTGKYMEKYPGIRVQTARNGGMALKIAKKDHMCRICSRKDGEMQPE
jgi:hypothetical protein